MIATAKGFFDGQQIVLEPPVRLEAGQEVVIAYTVVASSEKKSAKIERCKGIVKRKIWFPAKEMFPMVTQMGKFMNDFTSYNSGSGARNNHDDANDAVCSFADEVIDDSMSMLEVIPVYRPF